jgi:hypothetical protein
MLYWKPFLKSSLVAGIAAPFFFVQNAMAGQKLTLPKEKVSSFKDLRARVGFEVQQYPTSIDANSDRLNSNQLLSASLEGKTTLGSGLGVFDLGVGKAINLNYSYLSIQELFGQMALNGVATAIEVGRRRTDWNQADQRWNLGFWEPENFHDSLRPKRQGLTGMFANIDRQDFAVEVFATPIFIPTMSPDIAENRGQITSESRWFRSLPSSSPLLGRNTQLVYTLDIPDRTELVNNPGYGLRGRWKNKSLWLQISLAQKPVNALSYKYDASISAGAKNQGQIELSPVVHRHQILSADFNAEVAGWILGASYVADRPESRDVTNQKNSKGFTTDYIMQQLKPSQVFTLSADKSFELPLVNRAATFSIDYLKAQVTDSVDVDSKGIEQTRLVPDRLNFTNAISFSGSIEWRESLVQRIKFLRDFDQQGTLLSLAFDYKPSRDWAISCGGDSLSVDNEKQVDGFLSRYRQNDRLFAGVNYVY